jgi:glucose-1-phosphate thymidylyltransferase
MKGLILAGGLGTRLRPLTFTGNKHTIPIANKPMILYGFEHLVRAGIKDIGIILGPLHEGIKELVGDGSVYGVNITYINQPIPKGLAHAVLIAEEFLGKEPFVMYLGDNLLKQGVVPLIDTYKRDQCDCVICVTSVKNPSQYGVVEMKGNKVTRLVEKPQEPKSNLALVGIYLFNASIFKAVRNIKPSWRNELEITDAIQYLLDNNKKIAVQNVEGWWKDTGRPDDLLEANRLVLEDIDPLHNGIIEPNCNIQGKVSVGKGSIIKSNTTITGPALIGENCIIGPGVRIGPHTSIGDNSKILAGEVEESIVMRSVTINCNKRIVGSIIGRQSVLESADEHSSGMRLVLGENSICKF